MIDFPHTIDITAGSLLFAVEQKMDVEITHRIAAMVRILDTNGNPGIRDIIPSYASVLVIYNETITTSFDVIDALNLAWKQALELSLSGQTDIVTIGVVYGDKSGDDLANVSRFAGMSVDDVITLHASGTYTVGAVGFAPGFTYLIGLPPKLATPRRATPRLTVPAGSVGIGGPQTGVYALPSAGGWNLIGRSPMRLFDPLADPPVKLSLGDRVKFQPIVDADFSVLESVPAAPAGDGPIEVLSPGFQSTVQDLGRYGMARYGFATDGGVDRASLIAANRLVGNQDGTSCLELAHQGPMLRFHRRMKFALAGADLGARLNGRSLHPGRTFETMPHDELSFRQAPNARGARAYLAVLGGFDVPLVMGSASTNLLAGIGGWCGRALLAGDRLPVGQVDVQPNVFTPGLQLSSTVSALGQPFRILPGPQRHRFDDATWNRLLSADFTVSNDANRVGIRLLGESLAPSDGADILSEGIVTGSIQVTGEGQAIVMLSGHATIGGYTKIATVIPQDWDRLGQLSPGDEIHFVEAD